MAKSRNPRAAATGRSKTSGKKPTIAEPSRRPAGSTPRVRRSVPKRDARQSPLARAQKLIYEAFENFDPDRQITLAQRALKLSRDCADAYTMLAEYAPDTMHALALCAEGVSAAERAMGPELLRTASGNFWAIVETRPYMRARLALAQQLWSAGHRGESIEHLKDLIRLNPSDNQGVRYILAARLIEEGHDAELRKLLDQYDEPSAFWSFSKALATFRREGDTEAARNELKTARKRNKHITAMLLSKAPSLPYQPDGYSPGDESEALVYLEDFGGGWRQTPGAITWLRSATAAAKRRKRKRKSDAAIGPTAAVKERLLRLPQRFGTEWQASVHPLPTWVEELGFPQRPWAVMTVDHTEHTVIGQDMIVECPTVEQVFDRLAAAMERPLIGLAHRPSEIQVLDEPVWETIRPHLEEIGVDCIFRSELDEVKYIQGQMQEMFLADQMFPGLTEIPKIQLSQVAGFFAAADSFYRQAPWRRVSTETAIRVECEQLRKHRALPWYAGVTGQGGLIQGVALYSDLKALRELWWGEMPPELAVSMLEAISVLYSEAFEIPMADFLACEQQKWPLAGPEAYPMVIYSQPGFDNRQPEPWELHLLEGCLLAIPEFLARHELLVEPAEETITVGTSQGKLALKLSWAPEAEACGEDCEDCDEECEMH
jgi:tetratricopeptide (TPR) repeat protein